MGSLAFVPPPPRGYDAFTLRELPGCPADEKTDEYSEFVAESFSRLGMAPDEATCVYCLATLSMGNSPRLWHCMLCTAVN
eukprot:COSAG05_NODE_2474_length_3022_cov_2.143885_3_plen_80_part_00